MLFSTVYELYFALENGVLKIIALSFFIVINSISKKSFFSYPSDFKLSG